MAKKPKVVIPINHKDLLGRDLDVGNFVVASSYGNDLAVYSIVKMTPKMIRIKRTKSKHDKPVYPAQVVKLTDEQELTMLILKDKV